MVRSRATAGLFTFAALAWICVACDPCFGTPSCRQPPEVSYSGQVVEHLTGLPVPGVQLRFVRLGGANLTADTIAGTSDSDGFFQLRGAAFVAGLVHGKLIVTPPAPHVPYTVDTLTLQTVESRGDGLFAGRLVVDPYYLFVGEVRDRVTGEIVRDAEIRFERTGGIPVTPDTFTVTSDQDGRVFVEMRMHGAGRVHGDAIVTAPGYPRPYRIRLHLLARYIDRPAREIDVLKLGSAIQYVAMIFRRGTNDALPGTTFEFRRTGGIPIEPDTFVLDVPANGLLAIVPKPLGDGAAVGDVIIRPPAPYATETFTGVRLEALDGDTTGRLEFGYGTQVYARAKFRYRATGLAVVGGIQGIVRRTSGLSFDPDGAIVLLDTAGILRYTAATASTGVSTVDIEIRLREPFDADTIVGLTLLSRQDSLATDFGTFAVGRWLPWIGSIRDNATNAPVGGAHVTFRRTSGVSIAPTQVTATTAADGAFRIQALPLRDGDVIGDLLVTFDSVYRDTTLTGVRLATSTDDTLRLLASVRVEKQAP